MPSVKIEIPRKIGGVLHGVHYIRNSNGKKADPFIILCHGLTGDKTEVGRYPRAAERFQSVGYDCIIFDFSGSGENMREPVLLDRQIHDLEDVFEWTQNQGYKNVGVLGLSFGGLTALLTPLPNRKVQVFWAPAINMKRVFRENKGFLMRFYFFFHKRKVIEIPSSGGHPPIWLTPMLLKEVETLDPYPYLAKFTTPTLIIQGKTDTDVHVEDTRVAFNHMPKDDTHQMIEIDNCDHEFNGEKAELFIDYSIKWFDRFLK
jgi:dipeptidyl aminopeptidase/acylaminoacyl peptidase